MDQEKNQNVETISEETALPVTTRIPPLPRWPTSRPGPEVTEPPPGQKPMPLRPEQVVEVNYDQERGVSLVPRADEPLTE